ncbi:uncharacterized protein TRIADDRAFT_32641 [Trichoplax adhaerens]|uniref:RING-type domain-containing protein n=1 Tax=Trichoplax adhaerens TaxID=10228 RepID=B3SBA0_TRIAD|nr:hypothetical protein TRIADDRAFT_32641 [Trichoplax adhaerens]EDV19924.1 hypothetical protein TRIADDRAFT_32641 [Trichoplax adhaerens]|eukprot:XP_002117514.1 hypothetical protein TRIADDRAFT_32641 [Trichoplax adhaerens]
MQQAEEKLRRKQDQFNQNAATIINELSKNQPLESSSEEEDLDDTTIIHQLFVRYGDHQQEMDKMIQYFQSCCRSGSMTCLICIGGVRHQDAIWTCRLCQCIFHLACIAKWSKEGSVHVKPQLSALLFPQQETKWLCPNCRGEYTAKDYPTKYYCYCGKTIDPKFNPWLVPHSCGNLCERLLQPECGHRCQLLCHPGPCPPCPQMVKSTCYCGQGGTTIRRCGRQEWSCGRPCNKMLTCNKHKCARFCHSGECLKCDEVVERSCRCGKEVAHRPCDETDWQCDKICNKVLSCGFHRCERICHDNACGNCPRSGERSCPCGKSKFNLPCTDDVPSCGDTCGKILACGKHKCTDRCHHGDCYKCRQMVTKMCRCGKHQKSLQCRLDFTCESRCQILRDCGRHQCNKRCCTGNCPPCEQTCGRTLGCGNHKCQTRCHSGRCYPCPQTVDVKCYCQATAVTVPCGREKYIDPPKCKELCRIPPKCHHEKREPHLCHYGECPPCRQICNLILKDCEHYCPEICHTAVAIVQKMTALQITRLKKGEKPVTQYKSKPCLPCVVPIDRKCLGEHEIQSFPCHQLRPYSCGRLCGRSLQCTNHTCSLECHIVTNAQDEYSSGSECLQCEEACLKPRPDGCDHECPLPCHPGECPTCTLLVKRWCFCRLVLLHIECNELTTADDEKKLILLSCKGQCPKTLTCGHRCADDCHPGECPSWTTCNRKRTIRCACKRLKKVSCVTVDL